MMSPTVYIQPTSFSIFKGFKDQVQGIPHCPIKKYRINISTEGPIRPEASNLVLPFHERDIFKLVMNGLCNEWKSFIVHGPYQSGKTTFLLALEKELKNIGIEVIYFEMTGAKGSISKYGSKDGFTRFILNFIFGVTLTEEELYR